MAEQQRKSPDSGRRMPWHAFTVRLAIGLTAVGAAFWMYGQASDSGRAGTFGEWALPMMRFGVSYIGGFVLGWLLRRFLKWTLLIAGLIVAAIFILKATGLIDLPWDRIQGDVKQGSDWLQEQAGNAKRLVTGYLPSGVAAVIGAFLGFWRR
jgi:uncharacterized membrane protein (Fun14 family)